jgi:Domain of unknown function (DUF6382)/FHA domain
MYGYRSDFIHEGKMRMLLTREPAVHSNDLDTYQVNMLRFNEVPHLLPIEIREVDFEVTFLYDISGKKMLEQVLRSLQITAIQYFEWMFQLVNVLEGCCAYMLHPNQILLHERFIYVDGYSWSSSLYTAYIPTEEPLHPQAGLEGLKRLGILLSSHVSHWDGDGFQRVVQLLSQEGTTLADVRGLLQSLIVGTASGASANRNQSGRGQFFPGSGERDERKSKQQAAYGQAGLHNEQGKNDGNLMAEPFAEVQKRMPVTSAGSISNPTMDRYDREHSNHSGTDAANEAITPITKKYTLVTSVVVIAAAGLGWKFGYMSQPTSEVFTYTVIWNIAVIALGAMFLTGIPSMWWSKRFSRKKDSRVSADEQDSQPGSSHGWNNPNRLPDFLSMELSHLPHPTDAMGAHSNNAKGGQQHQEFVASSPTWTGESSGGYMNGQIAPHAAVSSTDIAGIGQQQRIGIPASASQLGPQSFDNELRSRSVDGTSQAPIMSTADRYYAALTEHTVILNPSSADATVMLGEMEEQGEGSQQEPYLQQLDEAGITVVGTHPIRGFPFIIGRAEQGVSHRNDSMGVSKHHCELIPTSEGNLELRDLGSRNGTELQGELLIPYKLYPLKDGDKLAVARSQYIFRAG